MALSLQQGQDLARAFGLGALQGPLAAHQGANSIVCWLHTAEGRYLAKGRDPLERPAAALAREHALIRQLVTGGFPTPDVVPAPNGETIVHHAGRLWSLYRPASGEDRYRDASVFEPFVSVAEARSAGAMLARFHRAAKGFEAPAALAAAGLSARFDLAWRADLEEAVASLLVDQPPALAMVTEPRDWPQARDRFDRLRQGLPRTQQGTFDRHALPEGIIHGDWIKRNLFFSGPTVSAVVDFDLACDAPLAYDLALAISAAAYPWPHLQAGEEPYHDHARAMREGYESVRVLTSVETAVLPCLLALCRFEFHLRLV
ncbi:MAG: phosphotransferase, partial [Cyanobacteria bacterium REEB65]|nr:phosphotransferase [Cyanobacteria bacterium REEB65]